MKLRNQKFLNKFSEQTVKRVVFLVLLVVMSVSMFSIDTYYDPLTTYEYSLIFLNNINNNYNTTKIVAWINTYQIENTRVDLIDISKTGSNSFDIKFHDIDNFRNDEIDSVEYNELSVDASLKQINQFDWILSLNNTVFVVLLVLVSAMLISRDATELVLQPLETIMFKVNDMAEDPFQILKFNGEDQTKNTIVYKNKFPVN